VPHACGREDDGEAHLKIVEYLEGLKVI